MIPWVAYHPTDKKIAVGEHGFNLHKNFAVRNVAEYLDSGLKLKVLKGIMKLPVIGNSKLVEDITKLQKVKKMVTGV
jgi:hypothetical protein